MCNRRHRDGVPIKRHGIGWKIFDQTTDSKSGALANLVTCFGGAPISPQKSGLVKWKSKMAPDGEGFCFFLTKEEAERCLVTLNSPINPIIKKLHFYGGIEKHQEVGIKSGYSFETALCKSYRILTEEVI